MKDAPVGWVMLMYDLEDAQEDLGTLRTQMKNDPEFDEECIRVRLGHIYWHLNRAWHRRNVADELSEDEEAQAGQFPNDLLPI
jgi:hypothetical protein